MVSIQRVFIERLNNTGTNIIGKSVPSIYSGMSFERKWDDLLKSNRIIIIAEAGAGKSYECREQSKRLWNNGEPSFFINLSDLANNILMDLLSDEEKQRFKQWMDTPSQIATFFLDSIDELKLASCTFTLALNKIKSCIGENLRRARIVITTRPIAFDVETLRTILPASQMPSAEYEIEPSESEKNPKLLKRNSIRKALKEDSFSEINDGNSFYKLLDRIANKEQSSGWKIVTLAPLSDEQISELLLHHDVSDRECLIEGLSAQNNLQFIRRPQDLVFISADWRENKKIRQYRDQINTSIRKKLEPSPDRLEPAELSNDKAFEGATRLAFALQMKRCFTIYYDIALGDLRYDIVHDDSRVHIALDPQNILTDWKLKEIKALLERPLFEFASYGRVCFPNRSILEYLAAQRLIDLRKQGMSYRDLKPLIFVDNGEKTVVRPSKRSVAGWLALNEPQVFEFLRDNDPVLLLDEGDPGALTLEQRNQTLRAYVDHYGAGGPRGTSINASQLNRFASTELAETIDIIWRNGIANTEVRQVLIDIIKAGKIEKCADILFDIVTNVDAHETERIKAINALVALDDTRLCDISSMCSSDKWPAPIKYTVISSLFPKYMSPRQFFQIFKDIETNEQYATNVYRKFIRKISTSSFDSSILEELRDLLCKQVKDDLDLSLEKRPHLVGMLVAICTLGLEKCSKTEWLKASVVALRLISKDYCDAEMITSLYARLRDLSAEETEQLFRYACSFIYKYGKVTKPRYFATEIAVCEGLVQLQADRDFTWVSKVLGDPRRPSNEREMALHAAIKLLSCNDEKWVDKANELKHLVVDNKSLEEKLVKEYNLLEQEKQQQYQSYTKTKCEKDEKEAEKRLKKEKVSQFLVDVNKDPEKVFSEELYWSNAVRMWRIMTSHGGMDKKSGWNSEYINKELNQTAVRVLRKAMKDFWRNENPTFGSERCPEDRDKINEGWLVGLAGIYAEAEESDWEDKLSTDEVEKALRYASIKQNYLPEWIEKLINKYPTIVGKTLGKELLWELNLPNDKKTCLCLLRCILVANEKVTKLFIPQLMLWLDSVDEHIEDNDNLRKMHEQVEQITRIILQHGDANQLSDLKQQVLRRLEKKLIAKQKYIWLSSLILIDPEKGFEQLEENLQMLGPQKAVLCLGGLFKTTSVIDEKISPQLLLKFLRFAYRQIEIQHDAHHEGLYTMDDRDLAECIRGDIYAAVLNLKGNAGLLIKHEIEKDKLFAHCKDHILAVIEQRRAEEIDVEIFNEDQVKSLEKNLQAQALTNEAIFTMMKNRLLDIDDFLLRDDSPRELWAKITLEREMRREIARYLNDHSNSIYRVTQESVTGDEKETDIRLCSNASAHEAVIELKLANNNWTARDLLDSIENQLVKKYMCEKNRKAGALVIVLTKDRSWKHPDDSSKLINADELFSLLKAEADRVKNACKCEIFIYVHLLDLRSKNNRKSLTKT